MSPNIEALAARVDALQAKVDKAEGFAEACRGAAARLRGPLEAISSVSVNVGQMRSRSVKVDRARAKASSAADVIRSARDRVSEVISDLDALARTYQRRADAARADLKAASTQLALAAASGMG